MHDPGALELGLERANRGLDLSAGAVELCGLAGRRGLRVQERGDQRERLGDLSGGVLEVAFDHPDGDVGRAGRSAPATAAKVVADSVQIGLPEAMASGTIAPPSGRPSILCRHAGTGPA